MTPPVTGIFGSTFRQGWDDDVLGDAAWLAALVEVESTLVRAGAQAGAVPASAATVILGVFAGLELDPASIGAESGAGGNPVIPLTQALKAAVPPEFRQYVHLGATSQDILDTAVMLLARRALAVIGKHLGTAADLAAGLAAEHADTPMAGRTLLQDALPITLGLKAATWLSGLDGARDRLAALVLPVQYGGPVGSLSGTGGVGLAIRGELARLLDLAEPDLAWHTIRLPIADLAGALGTTAGVAGKVALDIVLLAQTAVGEATEGRTAGEPGRGGSSSMPHKHNPIAAVSARACALRTPGLVGTLLSAMPQEHERAAGAWHSEWETLTDLLRLTGSAVAWVADSLQHLQVDAVAMAAATQGLPVGQDESAALVGAALTHRRRGVHTRKEFGR